MTPAEPAPSPSQPPPAATPAVTWARLRLAVLAAAVLAGFVAVTLSGRFDLTGLRTWVAQAGLAGAVAWVLASALLGALLVPGPVLATTAGLLFGPVLGAVLALVSTLGTTTIALVGGRCAGHDGARSLVPPQRLARLERLRDRFGMTVVLLQRIVPGLPDTVSNYLFGALGFRLRDALLGTLLGATPWAIAYTLLGSSLDDPFSVRGALAAGAFVVAGAIGVAAGIRGRRLLDPEADGRLPNG